MTRTLPTWQDDWSDGCSVFAMLPERMRTPLQRKLMRLLSGSPEAELAVFQACVKHDEAYYYGGSKRHRREADEVLRGRWHEAGLPRWFVWTGLHAIHVFGGPDWRREGVSWAFGGEHFRYDDEPAQPEG